MVKITIKDLTFSYNSTHILQDLDLVVESSEILGLVGPNGSGKTTLIKCIDRILRPKGSIFLDELDLQKLGRQEIARLIGYVPQSSSSTLAATVFDTVLMGRRPHMSWRVSQRDLDKVAEVMEMLHIEEFALKDFGELSGGQRQKVLIARALCQEPSVLLLDEPTSNLDMRHQLEVMEMVRDLVVEGEISAVMAIHDLNLAATFVDKLAILKDGRIYAAGKPGELLSTEMIRYVYGVEAMVMSGPNGPDGPNGPARPYVVPIRSLNGANGGYACE